MTVLLHSQEIAGVFIPQKGDRAAALAELFCEMFSDDQARFFNYVASLSAGWKRPACFQWRMMEDDITAQGRDLLREMFNNTAKEGERCI